MKKNANYVEHQIVALLNKKQDVRVSGSNMTVEILREPHCKGDLGNGSKAKIDYLVNFLGYKRLFVTDFKHLKFK